MNNAIQFDILKFNKNTSLQMKKDIKNIDSKFMSI